MGILDIFRRPVGTNAKSGAVSKRTASGFREYLSEEEAEAFLPSPTGETIVQLRDGFFFHPPSGKYAAAGNRAATRNGLRSYNVRGATYYDAAKADTSPGVPVTFVREADNPHDPNAVAVWSSRGGRAIKVGHVPKGRARSIAKLLDAGKTVEAYFMRGGKPGTARGPYAVLETDGETMRRLLGG